MNNILTFHDRIELQSHRLSYAYGHIYPLYAPKDRLLPFQLTRIKNQRNLSTISLIHKDGGIIYNLLGLPVTYKEYGDMEKIIYTATASLAQNIAEGQYYLYISDGVNDWYSDIITLVQDIIPYLKIEWWDNQDMEVGRNIISYTEPLFKNIMYLCTEIGKPDYQFEEEGEQRDGYFFPIKQLSEKTYKFSFLATENVLDAMRLIRMSDNIKVTDKYGRQYNCDTFLITPKWEAQGDLASVTAEFQTDTIAKKLGKGYIIAQRGDFNNDFNNDFNH